MKEEMDEPYWQPLTGLGPLHHPKIWHKTDHVVGARQEIVFHYSRAVI